MRIIGKLFGSLAAAVAVITVASLPWMLGGVIPLARLVLLAGCVGAGLLSILANLFQRRLPSSLPALVIPLAGLAMLGTWQLRPAETSPAEAMSHTVSDVADAEISGTQPGASLIPADTRSTVATLIAVIILSFVCFDQIRTRTAVNIAALLLVLNGIGITAVGFIQLFDDKTFELNKIWSLGGRDPFATFVNANNAAGWLCLCFAAAMGGLAFQLRSGPGDEHSLKELKIPLMTRIRQQMMRFLADLTVWQIVAFLSVTFLAAGVAATKSRGGILALVCGLAVASAWKSSLRQLPLVLLMLAVVVTGVFGTLHWLELDQGVVGEMETLRDLNQAAGSRPRHWLDSMHAVQDFPLTGTGLGSYRFANLPYQSRHTDLWFRNADNFYVDMVLEGGIIGLVLFMSVGICGLVTGAAGWRHSRVETGGGGRRASGDSRRLIAATGTAVIVAVLTQAASGFFDYGVGMPAAAALLVLIISAAAGCLDEVDPSAAISRSAAIRCGGLVVLCSQISLIAAGVAFFPDQKLAADIDESVVAGSRIVTHPVTPEKLDRLPLERKLLQERLQHRPDDPEGLWVLSRLADADFRLQVILASRGAAVRELPGFELIWQDYSLTRLANQLASLSQQDKATAKLLRSQLQPMLATSQLAEILEYLQRHFPLMPRVATARAEIAILVADDELFTQQVSRAIFAEPANATIYMVLGAFARRSGHTELAKTLWENSIRLSTQHQALILADAQQSWSADEAMQLFGPEGYVASVQAAQICRDPNLKAVLYDRAEEFWTAQSVDLTEEVELLRAMHLAVTSRRADAITWLQICVRKPGNRISQRRQLARLQEEEGKFNDAMGHWRRIKDLQPGDIEATAAIDRLKNLK